MTLEEEELILPVLLEPSLTLIGGHRQSDEEYLQVYRHNDRHGILKLARGPANSAALTNEARVLEALPPGPWPVVSHRGRDWSFQTDMGVTDPSPTDGEAFRRNMVKLLWQLRAANVRHGDSTSANIILRDNVPFLIDWAESHFLDEIAPQKQPWSDSWMLLRTVRDWATDPDHPDPLHAGIADTPRIARRWMAILADQGATGAVPALPLAGRSLLDLGTFQGDFVALAACERMSAWGIDQGGFRGGENSIEIARELWGFMGDARQVEGGVHFDQANIMDLHGFTSDIVLMFSTWSYMVADFGREAATAKLAEIISDCGVFYFENQLSGDGPGPDFFESDADIDEFLRIECGARLVKPLATIPVVGRDAARTVWRVEK